MNRFHSQKLIEATDGLLKGRLNSKRRQTILRQNNTYETEQTEPPICINFSSFLDEAVCSVPDLEELPNPDSTDLPSFLGQNYENRD